MAKKPTAAELAAAAAAKKAKEAARSIQGQVNEIDRFNQALSKSNSLLAQNPKLANEANERLMALAEANKEIGMTAREANEIYNKLSKDLSSRVKKGFDDSSGALVQQTKIWEQLGVQTETTTEFVDLFQTALGSSTNQVIKTGRVLHDFAARTGQDANRVFKELHGSAKDFFDILDQGEMTKQMLTFQGRARSMGMTMGSLMGIMDKFETIDGGQKVGAKLNATLTALGGSFDSVKASALDYPERMNYIASAIQRVMPRIRRSNPRAQRLYMRSLRDSLGIDSVQMRKLMQYKPGQVMGEGDLLAGRVTGISAGREFAAARRATTMVEQADALEDAVYKALTRTAAKAVGVTAPEFVAAFKAVTTTEVSKIYQLVATKLDELAEKSATGLRTTKFHKEMSDVVATLMKRAEAHNDKLVASQAKLATAMTKVGG